MKGPDTAISIERPLSLSDHDASAPFDRRNRKHACCAQIVRTLGPAATGEVSRAADDHERQRLRQPHRNHVGGDELAHPDAGIKTSGREIDQLFACGKLHLDLWKRLAERGDQRLQQDRHDRARHGEAQEPRRPLSELTRCPACRDEFLEGRSCARKNLSPASVRPTLRVVRMKSAAPTRASSVRTA